MSTTRRTPARKLAAALADFLSRQDRTSNPDGTFDKAGRWYPSDSERCDCCTAVRGPSRAYPYSYMTHCRTAAHVAKLHGVPLADLRRAARVEKPPKREGGDCYYKAVAVLADGRLVSIYDGETEYRVGVTLNGCARQDHGGGYYVYPSIEAARNCSVPNTSKASHLPRIILRVRAEGTYCRYDNGKLSFSRITPTEEVEGVLPVARRND